MAKLLFLFIMALCLTQNFQRTLADPEEEKEEIKANLKILKFKLPSKYQELFVKLQNVYETKLKKLMKTNINLTRIFMFAKEEIADHFDNFSVAVECSVLAYKELEKLDVKTKTDVTNCVDKYINKTNEIRQELTHDIIKTTNSISTDLTARIVKCLQKFKIDDGLLVNCLDFIETTELPKFIDDATLSTAKTTILILEQLVEDIDACFKEVEVVALMNTEHVTDEFKFCINEV